jgi:Peptidase family M48
VDDSGGRLLQPLAYHRDLVNFLKAKEPELWTWMRAAQIASQSTEVRSELLRSTYRVDSDAHPEIVGAAAAAGKVLGIAVPISVYQSEGEASPNAALIYVPDEAIVLLSGPIAELLNPAELTAIMGHELAHFVLWTIDDGDHLIADRLVNAVANDSFDDAYIETSRLLSLSTELFADRGALLACRDLHTTVSALVKVSTGMRTVSAASYLRQAEELLAMDASASIRTTHPETVLRAAAIDLWSAGAAELSGALSVAIYGNDGFDRLDLLGQRRVEDRTRNMIGLLLRVEWFRTDLVLAHARAFFSDSAWLPHYPGGHTQANPRAYVLDDAALAAVRSERDEASTKKFFAYLLLDFAVIDPDLLPASIVETVLLAHALGFGNEYETIVKEELSLKKKDLAAVVAEARDRWLQHSEQANKRSAARTDANSQGENNQGENNQGENNQGENNQGVQSSEEGADAPVQADGLARTMSPTNREGSDQ